MEQGCRTAAPSHFCLQPMSLSSPCGGKAAFITVILILEFTCFMGGARGGLEANELWLKQGELCSLSFGGTLSSSAALPCSEPVLTLFLLALALFCFIRAGLQRIAAVC